MKNEPAKIHQARRRATFRCLGGSGWPAGGFGSRQGQRMAVRTRPVHPRDWYRWRRATGTFVPVGRSGGGVPGPRGVVAAVALDPVERRVGRGDELGRGPAIGREGGDADRRADRDRAALLADEGVVPERLEDPLGGAAGLVARRSRAG